MCKSIVLVEVLAVLHDTPGFYTQFTTTSSICHAEKICIAITPIRLVLLQCIGQADRGFGAVFGRGDGREAGFAQRR